MWSSSEVSPGEPDRDGTRLWGLVRFPFISTADHLFAVPSTRGQHHTRVLPWRVVGSASQMFSGIQGRLLLGVPFPSPDRWITAHMIWWLLGDEGGMFSQCCHPPPRMQPPQELLPHLCDPRVPVCRLASKAPKQSGEALSRRSLGLYMCWGDCYTCFPPCGWKLIIEAMIYQALTTFNLSLTISWGRYWYICLVCEAWVRWLVQS